MAHSRVYLSPPHMDGLEQVFVQEAFSSNWLSSVGPNLTAFENEMCDYLGVPHGCALALGSGTSAIHLAMRLIGVKSGDTVVCASFTFAASVFPAVYDGATPVFVDSEASSWNICPVALEKCLASLHAQKRLPKAVIAVSLYGQSFGFDAVKAICDRWQVPLIEDAAEALGATYGDRKCGALGEYGILSFNGNKIITTSGGGMLIARDPKKIDHARALSTQARVPNVSHYQHEEIGFNYRMSNVLAGIGRGQLKVLDDRVAARRRVRARYEAGLGAEREISFMPVADFGISNQWLTAIRVAGPKAGSKNLKIIAALEAENIESRPAWKPMHLQPVFAGCEYFVAQDGVSVCDSIFDEGICLPSGSSLADADQDRVIDVVRRTLKSLR